MILAELVHPATEQHGLAGQSKEDTGRIPTAMATAPEPAVQVSLVRRFIVTEADVAIDPEERAVHSRVILERRPDR
jgi:hypothetical protein